jgi:hypothetical protein
MKELFLVGLVAQRLEQRTHNPLVPGSNPGGPTNVLPTSRFSWEWVDVFYFKLPDKLGTAPSWLGARSLLRKPAQKKSKTIADAVAGTIQMERQL